MKQIKLIRITTAPVSMRLLLAGQPAFMKGKGFDVTLISADGQDWKDIPHLEDYSVHIVCMARKIDLIKDIKALWKLIRLFRTIKPDIVHSHTPKAGLLAMLAARISGVPVRMHTVAGLPLMESTGLLRKVLILAEKGTYRCASMVYPNSYRLRDFILKERFISPIKLSVIANGSSNGIDTAYFEKTETLRSAATGWRAEHGISLRAPVFIFIGRIVKDKGINELLGAFDGLSGVLPDVVLLLVGSFEDDLDPVDARSRNIIGANPRVIHAGFQKDVRLFLSVADILVFPSYREGFPNVPMQAGCFGLPSIVTDINGCNEIIEDGVNGLIVPPKNEKALAEAMERMTLDQALRTRCAANARPRIVDRYQQSAVWDALYLEYERLLGKYS